jgi:hypothetical protein
MKFHVAGTYTFTLKIPDRPIFDGEEELEGRAMEGRRVILISCRVDPERRYEVLVHELGEAWGFFVPPPRTDEERHTLSEVIQRQLMFDLDAQGGRDALMEVIPEHVEFVESTPKASQVAARRDENYLAPDRRCCGNCGADVMCGSIEHGRPMFYEPTAEYQIPRWMECSCSAYTCWFEVCSADGQPLGKLVQVPPPKVLYGDQARQWIRQHRGEEAA